MLITDWELTPAATELLLGRPVGDFLEAHGVDAILTPEGSSGWRGRQRKVISDVFLLLATDY